MTDKPTESISQERYSAQFDAQFHSVITGLEALKHDRFRTAVFSASAEADNVLSWHDAVRLAPGNWNIRSHSAVALAGEEQKFEVRTNTVATNFCFFDALAAIARYNAAHAGLSDAAPDSFEGLPADMPPLFRDVANDEGVPFDLQKEMPLPVHNGIVLADGLYDASVLANRPRDPNTGLVSLAKEQALVPAEFRVGNFAPVVADETDLKKKKYKPALSRLNTHFSGANNALNYAVERKFARVTGSEITAWVGAGNAVGALAVGVGGLLLASPLGWLAVPMFVLGFPIVSVFGNSSDARRPRDVFNQFMEKSHEQISALPESHLKDDAKAFQTRYALTYYTLWVHDRLCKLNNKPNSKGARKAADAAWEALDNFCKEQKFSESDQDAIHTMIMDNVRSPTFKSDLINRIKVEQADILERIKKAGKKKHDIGPERASALPPPNTPPKLL